jgi:hypothetical protein
LQVKILAYFLLLSAALPSQTPGHPRTVTYSRADTAHCKVIAVNGKPLLETTDNGTSVAVGMLQNWGNGEFSVLVSVTQVGPGVAEVNPKGISALYSDAAHTRFTWFDKGHDLDTQASIRASGVSQSGGAPPESGPVGDSSAAMAAPTHPEAMRDPTTNPGTRSSEEERQLQLRQSASPARPQQLDPAHPPVFLRHATLKQGDKTYGYVFLRKSKGSKLEASPMGMLDEIDIPLNGTIFRF